MAGCVTQAAHFYLCFYSSHGYLLAELRHFISCVSFPIITFHFQSF